MRRKFTDPMPATVAPTTRDMLRAWRADRCVQDSSAALYLQWITRFRAYCAQRGLEEPAELTLEGAHRFIASYARRRHLDPSNLSGGRTALYALSRVYQVMGLSLPAWQAAHRARPPVMTLLRAYADHLARHRGSPEVTVHKKLDHVGKVLDHLAQQGKTWRTMTLLDIDEFLIGCSRRYARSTTAGIAGSVRSFARFLLATGRISVDLAESVISPVQVRYERRRRSHPVAAAGHRLERRHAHGRTAEDGCCLHLAAVTRGGQGAGTLPASRPSAAYADPASVRADEDALRPAEFCVPGAPHSHQACQGGRAGCTLPRQPRAAPLKRGAPDRRGDAPSGALRPARTL